MIDRLRRLGAVLLLAAGALGVLVGGGAYAHAWYTGWAWAQSDDAERAERRVAAETPLWIDDSIEPDAERPTLAPASPGDRTGEVVPVAEPPRAVSAGRAGLAGRSAVGPRTGRVQQSVRASRDAAVPEAGGSPDLPSDDGGRDDGLLGPDDGLLAPHDGLLGPYDDLLEDAPIPPVAAEEIELAEAQFRFLDPPEPGATAKLSVVLRSHADNPSGPIALSIASRWFEGFSIIGAVPDVIADRLERDGYRSFDFPGLQPRETVELELYVTATAEDLEPPDVRLALVGGGIVGQTRPRTVAPRPRPGPVSAVNLPRLGIRSGVVQTAWEPPPFVVGQIRGTANVSQGNTVLIGHIAGAAGNVFASLEQVRPGDEVVAISRGLEYRFLVSETVVGPNDDSSPTLPTDTPRLTLMTCVGNWNPITHDYSHRLWVTAEPPELAQATIAANAERAAREAAEREVAARVAAAREAAERETAEREAAAQQRAARRAAVATETAAQAAAQAAAPTAAVVEEASAVDDEPLIADAELPVADAEPAVADEPVVADDEPPAAPAPPAPASVAIAPQARPAPAPAPPSRPTARSATATPAPPAPTSAPPPTVAAARRPAQAAPVRAGLQIRAPAAEARVARRIVVQGARAVPADPDVHVWLLVRADVEGGRWYAYPREIVARPDGAWEAELDLDGPANIRHELRVGVADADAHAALTRHTTTSPNEPLASLPKGFSDEARVVVIRG